MPAIPSAADFEWWHWPFFAMAWLAGGILMSAARESLRGAPNFAGRNKRGKKKPRR